MSFTEDRLSPPRALPRILQGLDSSPGPMDMLRHERVHGPLPRLSPERLIDVVERSGLRGRGGADFPTAVKLRAVASRRHMSALVVNGSETEPASLKDHLLLARLPHLVLDGALLAARAVGAGEIIVKVDQNAVDPVEALEQAISERDSVEMPISLAVGPDGYVTGEETAVIQFLNGHPAKPRFVPPRPFDRGYRNRPTLIQNPETLAQLALVARHGDTWYRELGTSVDPGSVLVTISGAVAHPGVYELAFGTPMLDLLQAAGGGTEPLQALLVGGYFGTWMPARATPHLHLSREELNSAGCSLGAGVIIALGQSSCGLHESARIVDYLAGQSTGQCGPCVHGLAAIAGAFGALADGVAHGREQDRLLRWCSDVRGRGACHHPNGVVRFVESALEVFGPELATHGAGPCRSRPAGLPLGPQVGWHST
ncbi:MAG TPA: NADH-ubiquinone oxidoreductase-F iron-sulfur binding region domain-containing protein [Solirubrobacteraceae bacterium]|jgi:NADH:ubiquinone oxidoreductase subunit F (NADH-binding)|nr:NADH-ubiquinone oxidoreductase-F iron-sulfur binding region domain-containing protein [Solirubrobacteraceae bacterium]